MSVSSISSNGSAALFFKRLSRNSASTSSSTDAQSTTSTDASASSTASTDQARGSGTPPDGAQGPGGGHGHHGGPGGAGGGGRLEKFEDILKNGGDASDLKAEVDKEFDTFKSSDKFKSLSADQQQAIQDRHDSSDETDKFQGLVDQYANTGTLKPPEGGAGDASGRALAELQQRGQSRQAEVYSKFGVGGFGTSTTCDGTDAASTATASASSGADLL